MTPPGRLAAREPHSPMHVLISLLTPPSQCEYLPQEVWQLRQNVFRDLDAAAYMSQLREGWRRFGPVVFRPECPSCRRCQSLRVPTAGFRPNESQRRVWRANEHELEIRVGVPAASAAKLDLFQRFHRWKHETQGWPDPSDQDLAPFVDNPFPTEEWTYYVGDRLIGVGYVDDLPEGLSAIYFFYEPEERWRSLGTFNVLAILRAAHERGRRHVYLGYYVEGCRSLEYKARFRPNERLGGDGRWAPFCR